MENRQLEILSEIKSMMASIRSQLEMLDAKMAEFQQAAGSEGFEAEPVDLDIDIEDIHEERPVETVTVQEIPLEAPVEEPIEAPVEEPQLRHAELVSASAAEVVANEIPDQVRDDVAEVLSDDVAEVLSDDVTEVLSDAVAEVLSDDVAEIVEDIPEEIFCAPAPEPEPVPEPKAAPEPVTIAEKAEAKAGLTINDTLADNCAWRHDMPGTPVRDIRSAISLNDRVIFINLLFEEDAQTFVNTLAQINTMETLDQAVEYIMARFPSWDMNSELVYRFMMAVRRKVK